MVVSELKYWIWLSELFEKGSDKPSGLLDAFETPERIFAASAKELSATGILTAADVARITRHSLERSEFIQKECARLRITILPRNAEAYPERLRHIYGAPIVLYTYGLLAGLEESATLGVVGTRYASHYGKTITDELCYQLALAGMVIVSGCAIGIDTHAHVGALKAGGRTIAVLGCGLDIDYPAENKGLKKEILKSGGALVSELPPGTPVSSKYFPVRNRIISGLSLGALVTEAPMRSGSLITLNLALEQGRDVFCVPPHDIHDARFCGVVKPLRDGAIAVYSANDILFEYYGEYSHKLSADKAMVDFVRQPSGNRSARASEEEKSKPTASKVSDPHPEQKAEKLELTGNAKKIYDALTREPQYVNELAENTGISLPELLSTLTELEIGGLIASYSGHSYARID